MREMLRNIGRCLKKLQKNQNPVILLSIIHFFMIKKSNMIMVQMKEELRKNQECVSRLEGENQSYKIKLDEQIQQISDLQLKERKIMMAMKMKNIAQQSSQTSAVNSRMTSVVNSRMGSKTELDLGQSQNTINIDKKRNRDSDKYRDDSRSQNPKKRSDSDKDSRTAKSTKSTSQKPSTFKNISSTKTDILESGNSPTKKTGLFQSFKNILAPSSSKKLKDHENSRNKSKSSKIRQDD